MVYDSKDNYYWDKDEEGREWPSTAVFMRKTIV